MSSHCSSSQLSYHDKAILNKIFNPNLPFNDVLEEDLNESQIESTPEERVAGELEVEGVRAAEKGELQRALELLNQAVDTAPHKASCYNNRAQALQLASNIDGALADLDKAVEFTEGKGKVACQALTQRGIIHKFKDKEVARRDFEAAAALGGEFWRMKHTNRQEDEARRDFEAAAALGGEFAREQAVAMNPYAALCNQMMAEVIRKVKSGEA